jgi:Tol biopolymer transport system component
METKDPAIGKRALRIAVPLILALLLFIVLESLVGAHLLGSLTRVTTATHAGGESWDPTISGDGTVIAFISDSDFLNEGRPPGVDEVWLYDTVALTYTRATSSTDGTREVRAPSLDADGSRVAFFSDIDYFGQGIQRGQYEIWMYDANALALTRITTATDASRESDIPSISADGRYIAFESDSDFLGQSIAHDHFEIWLYDTVTLTYTRLTTSTADRGAYQPQLCADGTRVVFRSDNDFLGSGIPEHQSELWLYDMAAMTYTRVTTTTGTGNRNVGDAECNGDGTLVVFRSNIDFFGQGIPETQNEIWLCDTATMAYTRVTTAAGSGNRASYRPILNYDGTRIVFYSDAEFLGQSIPDDQFEVWLYEVGTMALSRLTSAAGTGDRDSWGASPSDDGTMVAFSSDSGFLGQSIPDEQFEIWLWTEWEQYHHVYLPLVLKGP